MRGEAEAQTALFSYVSLAERVPRDHPLRKMRILVDAVLAMMDTDFAAVYAKRGRPSIPPEFLLRTLLIQISPRPMAPPSVRLPPGCSSRSAAHRAKSLGADKGYDTAEFVTICRRHKVAPQVAAKKSGSAVDGRTTRHETYRVSIRIRKRIEEIFGWLKSVGGLRKSRHIGRPKLAGQVLLGCAAYNLVRIGSLNGWWDARHT